MTHISRLLVLLGLVAMRFLGFATTSSPDPSNVSAPPPAAPPASAHLLYRQQPLDTVEQHLILPGVAVRLVDVHGQAVADVPVTLSLPNGALRGITTATTDERGIARFDTLVVTRPGSYRLQARAGSLSAVDSAAFAVFPH